MQPAAHLCPLDLQRVPPPPQHHDLRCGHLELWQLRLQHKGLIGLALEHLVLLPQRCQTLACACQARHLGGELLNLASLQLQQLGLQSHHLGSGRGHTQRIHLNRIRKAGCTRRRVDE